MLASAGYAPVPVPVFNDRAAYEAVDAFFRNTPALTTARFVGPPSPAPSLWSRVVALFRFDYGESQPQPPRWDDWLEMAARGLFAYDLDGRFEAPGGYRM